MTYEIPSWKEPLGSEITGPEGNLIFFLDARSISGVSYRTYRNRARSFRVNRRRFLRAAGTGFAAGVTASTAISAIAGDDPPSPIPLPDPDTKQPAATSEPQPVCCTPAATLIFPCSGSADVGEIADHAARKLNADGVGKMSCLAGIGGRVGKLMEIAQGAEIMLAIDGCPLQCASNTLKAAGFEKVVHVSVAGLGMEKGKTPVTAEAVAKVAEAGKSKLGVQDKQK